MKKFSTACLRAVLLVLVAGAAQVASAQTSTTGGPTPQDPTAIPLDGGASLLLAGGVAYGLRRLRQRRKQ